MSPASVAKDDNTAKFEQKERENRSDYAQQYLEKIVNIEVPLPRLTDRNAEDITQTTTIDGQQDRSKKHCRLVAKRIVIWMVAFAIVTSAFWVSSNAPRWINVIAMRLPSDGVTLSRTSMTVKEGFSSTYTVKIDTEPMADVTITATRDNGGDQDLTVIAGSPIVFTARNWNIPQQVNIAAAPDDDGLDGTATIVHDVTSTDPGYRGISIDSVVVTEDDDIGVTVSPSRITVEEGSSARYTVVLDSKPIADVTVAATSAGGDPDLTVSRGSSLVFTPENWNAPQQVNIAAAPDDDGLDGTATFVHDVTSTDPGYRGISIDSVVVTEDDDIGVTVSPSRITVEEGSSARYTVVLDSKPIADVTIAATSAGGDPDLTVSRGSSLVFTPENWNAPQQVNIAAAPDDDALDGTATFVHEATSATSDYDGVSISRVIAIEDDFTYSDGQPVVPWRLVLSAAFLVLVSLAVFTHVLRREDDHTSDSADFERSLRIWHSLVRARRNSPRHLKRFINRVRYLAVLSSSCPAKEDAHKKPARSQNGTPASRRHDNQNLSEPTMVALAALQDLNIGGDNDDDSLPLCLVSAFSEPTDTEDDVTKEYNAWVNKTLDKLEKERQSAESDEFRKEFRHILDKAIMDHRDTFSAENHLITEAQIKRFGEITQGIVVRS